MPVEDWLAYESFRPSQRELASRVRENCARGGVLLAEAMSGFGKTAAVLCGALSAAEETGCKVVYTCRTKRQVSRVTEELSLIQKKRPLRAASMFSKYDYCLLKRTAGRFIPQDSFRWYCGFNVSNNLCSYFLNMSLLGTELDAAVERVSRAIPSHTGLLLQSEAIHACPYELVRLALTQADVVVVPYHYIFDPATRPVLFDRNTIEPEKVVLVVDEAHNLRDFLRSNGSGRLSAQDIEKAIAEAEGLFMARTAESLRALQGSVRAWADQITSWHLDRDAFIADLKRRHGEIWLQNLVFELTACSEAAWSSVASGRRLPYHILRVGEFLNKLQSSSRDLLLTKWEDQLGLADTNPVRDFPGFLRAFQSSVLVSATINPSELFLRSLSIDVLHPATYAVPAAPFITVRTVLDTGVTTKFKSRSPQMYSTMATKIAAIIRSCRNGVGVFAPSYAVLEPVRDAVAWRVPERRVFSESRGLSNEEANEMAESFRSEKGPVLFAVQGGRFSEGEDFKGDLMDATVVVGLSLPPPSPQLYAEYTYLKWNGEPESYLMLALLPALRKAFQAAGRHLRNPGKRGLVFLLDKRFDSPTVTDLMPSWLKGDLRKGDFTPPQIEGISDEFWGR